MIGGGPISPKIGLKHTDMAIYDVAGGILNFWLQIQESLWKSGPDDI